MDFPRSSCSYIVWTSKLGDCMMCFMLATTTVEKPLEENFREKLYFQLNLLLRGRVLEVVPFFTN